MNLPNIDRASWGSAKALRDVLSALRREEAKHEKKAQAFGMKLIVEQNAIARIHKQRTRVLARISELENG